MNIGQWLGKWAGNWFGTVGEADPNAMSGAASFAIAASGTLTNGGTVTPWEMAGAAVFSLSAGGHLTDASPSVVFGGYVRPRINRTKENDEALLLMLGML